MEECYFKMYRPHKRSKYVHIDVYGFHGDKQRAIDWLATFQEVKFDFELQSIKTINDVVQIVIVLSAS